MLNDMIDNELLENFLNKIADKYTAEEVCEILELDVWDILENFREKIMEKKESFEL